MVRKDEHSKRAPARELDEYLRLNHEKNDTVKRGALTGGSGLSPEKADHVIEKLLERGRLQRAAADTFLVLE